METKKLEEKEIKEIKEISNEKNQITVDLGKIKTDLILMEAQMDHMRKMEDDLVAKFKGNQTKGKKLMDKMNKKYGAGTINIDEGVFTPSAEENGKG
tara:strand:+ start:2362 stop:2652 length:291 start_codon:yes stop_codon:yes gene_type:complete